MPKVIVPPPYRGPTGGQGEVVVQGATVRDCLEEVERRFAGFLPQVVAADGSIHRFVRLFRNGERLEGAALDAPVDGDDEVEILAAIAGG
jgi:molybdopterin converting factor small subunit